MSAPVQATPLHVAECLANIVYEENGPNSLRAFKNELGRFLVIVATGEEVEKLQDRICEGTKL